MADRRSHRKHKVVKFIDKLERDRSNNLKSLVWRAQQLKLDGFDDINWQSAIWKVNAGRLLKPSGRNGTSATLNFSYSVKRGGEPLEGEWAELAKALFLLRFHRKNQAATNQRSFIVALSYIAIFANRFKQELSTLTPEVLSAACVAISKDYSETVAYNLHKAIGEIAAHCDSNGLCRNLLDFKYSQMKRPGCAGGVGYRRTDEHPSRLDDAAAHETNNEKMVAPVVIKTIGELYRNVPSDHKYRFYVLLLTLLVCTGRRFSEISLLPFQKVEKDSSLNAHYIKYFPRKMSQGEVFTPMRKLYLPNDVAPIVVDTIAELTELCKQARDTSLQMHECKGADISFLDHFSYNEKIYKKELTELGIPLSVFQPVGWIRKNGFTYTDKSSRRSNGTKASRPAIYTTRKGIEEYCNNYFNEDCLSPVHIDQQSREYFLKDLLLVRPLGLSSGKYAHWLSTQCTHSMMTTFLRYFGELSEEYASTTQDADFTSHHFRHTLNTLLDEGGLSDLLQTEWFGRSNPNDTKAYQHTSREKRALMIREDIRKGRAGGAVAKAYNKLPIDVADAYLEVKVRAVHDVGIGVCVHNFSQTPCQRHLQCSAECEDYVYAKSDTESRIEEVKRQLAMAVLAKDTALTQLNSSKPKHSSDWILQNEKKIGTLTEQLEVNGISGFDPYKYIKENSNE